MLKVTRTIMNKGHKLFPIPVRRQPFSTNPKVSKKHAIIFPLEEHFGRARLEKNGLYS